MWPCPPGVRGEVTLTGGRNPFAPLLRYRTGDFASLAIDGGKRLLVDLEGRRPVLFRAAGGRTIHSMEFSRRLRSFPLVQFTLRQEPTGEFAFRYRGSLDEMALRAALTDLVGDAPLSIARLEGSSPRGRKVVQYDAR
jgi:phenylacetate-CoA ligase